MHATNKSPSDVTTSSRLPEIQSILLAIANESSILTRMRMVVQGNKEAFVELECRRVDLAQLPDCLNELARQHDVVRERISNLDPTWRNTGDCSLPSVVVVWPQRSENLWPNESHSFSISIYGDTRRNRLANERTNVPFAHRTRNP